MKLNVPISHSRVDDEKEEEETPAPGISPATAERIVVGYAFTSKKMKSFLQPKLISLARSKGIEFIPIDLERSLSEQGPYNIILHKVCIRTNMAIVKSVPDKSQMLMCRYRKQSALPDCPLARSGGTRDSRLAGKEWSQVIEEYQKVHPEVTVLDPPEAIEHLRNRQSMLEVVADLKLPNCDGKVCVPRQLVISNFHSSVPDEVAKAGLSVPLVVKPLVVDGSAKSHELFLAYDQFSLSELEAPVVLQEFVNHGGVLFKVFIVGESIKVARRSSLPDVTKCDLSKISGVFKFPRVSSAAASAEDANLDHSIEPPPLSLLEVLAGQLRHRLGLRLFNVDLIRQSGTEDLYYIIDINYFPGFGKMPDYEHIFTDFLLSLSKASRNSEIAAQLV
ncbi:inositol-tetrakisphosphate 1-kinase 2 [Phtheirospermum japonicum]|uniref:Inositol-tetrakisphosphate 1-kinase n=1 Tax=Phtheirospermum japonicum TaxID=374723 RepID=A0A830BMC0_9LAMI|nr:inositol-tetrakisphosphate 1-kinase 2 [Phtheirospermum japonicum]